MSRRVWLPTNRLLILDNVCWAEPVPVNSGRWGTKFRTSDASDSSAGFFGTEQEARAAIERIMDGHPVLFDESPSLGIARALTAMVETQGRL